jgi:hypothetical protein
MHKILIYLHIIYLLKSSTCFEHCPAHLQEVYVVTVYMQALVSSLSAGDCRLHKTVTCREWRYQRLHIYNYDVDLLKMSRVMLETCRNFNKCKKGKVIPLQWPLGFLVGQGFRISRHSAHEGGKVVSLTHRPSLPPEITWYSFLKSESTPEHMELSDAPEINLQWPGIDPGTLRLVAQCLNHYATLSVNVLYVNK